MVKHERFSSTFTGINVLLVEWISHVLYTTPRDGWVKRQVNNPETFGLHIRSVVFLAEKFFYVEGLVKMLKICMWPKIFGDLRTDTFADPNDRHTGEAKRAFEEQKMSQLCALLGKEGVEIFSLWQEFRENRTMRAQIANELRSYQTIVKALEYEKAGYAVDAQDFFCHYEKKITDRTILNLLAKIKKGNHLD